MGVRVCRELSMLYNFWMVVWIQHTRRQRHTIELEPVFVKHIPPIYDCPKDRTVPLSNFYRTCTKFDQVAYTSFPVSILNIKALPQIVFEMSYSHGFNVKNHQKIAKTPTSVKTLRNLPKSWSGNLNLSHSQYTNYQSPSSNTSRDILLTMSQCKKLQKAITLTKVYRIRPKVK